LSTLTLAQAEQILAAAKVKAEEIGVQLTISVVDPRGDVIAVARMDGAPWRSPVISHGKALASACWGRSSGDMAENAQSGVSRAFMELMGGHFIPAQGALPVYSNGELLGAVGGSGASSQEDEDAARAGIEAIGLSVTA
jgi:uncharacterized protein GlcG (DUF336 family)